MNIVRGDLLLETEGIIVHGCNAQGVMGAGFAKSIKNKYPQVYNDYHSHCLRMYRDDPNKLLGSIVITQISPSLLIVSGITQQYYGRDTNVRYVSYDAIRSVFAGVRNLAIQTGLVVKYPMIGGGLGGGNFDHIKTVIDEALIDVPNHTLFVK